MSRPHDFEKGAWKRLLVSGVGVIGILWVWAVFNDRLFQPKAIPVAPGPVPPASATSPEPPSRLNPQEVALLEQFATEARSPDPHVREATLRNDGLVRAVRTLVVQTTLYPEVATIRQDVVSALRERLKDDAPAVRLAAVEAVVPGYLDRWHAVPPDGLKPADAFAVGEGLLTAKDPAIRLRAAVFLWVRNESAPAGKVLVSVVEDPMASPADRILAARTKLYSSSRRPEGMVPALADIIADPAAPVELRTTAVQEVKTVGDEAKRSLTADLRGKLQSSLTDAALPGELRADVLNLLVPVYPDTALPDRLRTTLAKLAQASDTPVPLRVRAFGLLEPPSDPFARTYPELARQLQSAVTDASLDPAFRAFAAYSYTPDTAEKFATVVRLLAEADEKTVVFRWALAGRLATQFPSQKRPPDEWLTAAVARQLTRCPPVFPVPETERVYHESGNPVWWLRDLRQQDVGDLTTDLLVSRWTDVLAELLAPLNDPSARGRNQRVLERVLRDHPAALWKALGELVKDARAAEPVRLQAMSWLYAGEKGRWPGDVSTPWSDRLVARDAGPEEKQFVWEWAVGRHASPIEAYGSLLDSQRGAVRALVAEKVARTGPAAKATIPHLINALKAEYQTTTAPYVSALAAMGRDSVSALGGLMKDTEPKLRTAAAEALGLIGPEGRSEATPILRTAVEQETNEAVKKAALEALGQVNPVEAKKFGWVAK